MEEKVKKYEHSVIFKDESFPDENSEKSIEDEKTVSEENSSEKEAPKEKVTAEQLKIGDVIKYIMWKDAVTGKETLLQPEYGVVRDINDNAADIESYSDIELQNVSGRKGQSISLLNRQGFEYIGTENEIKSKEKLDEVTKNVVEPIVQAEQLSLENIVNYNTKEKINAENFRITDERLGVGTASEKYQNNINAVKTLIAIENENREATP